MNSKSFFQFSGLVLLTTALLMSAALYNHFPLLNVDTGSYINNAYALHLPKDRPIFYSWFIRFLSRERSLWLVVLSQSALCATLICGFIFRFFGALPIAMKTAVIVLTTIGTGICWFSGMLMPDIFTPLLFLSGVLFIFSRSATQRILLALLFFGLSICHNANLMIGLLFAVAMIVVVWKADEKVLLTRNTILLTAVSILAWLSVCEINRKEGNGFTPSPVSHVFIMGRMIENGVAKAYLDDHCRTETLRLCPYKDELPQHAWDFIWNNDGAFAHSGYWDSSKQEYRYIINATLSSRKYVWLHLREAIKGTAVQIVQTSVGDALPATIGTSNAFYQIEGHYPQKAQYVRDSKQYQGKLKFENLNRLYLIFGISTVILFIVAIAKRGLPKIHKSLLVGTIAFLIINAFISCCFANILPRLNARAMWLFPMIVLLVTASNIQGSILRKSKV